MNPPNLLDSYCHTPYEILSDSDHDWGFLVRFCFVNFVNFICLLVLHVHVWSDDNNVKGLLSNFADESCQVPTDTPTYYLATDSCSQEGNISYSFSLYEYPGLWGGYRGWQLSCVDNGNELEELPEHESFFTVT